jgi:CRISPR/Cas system endoribonuclease Cas6 (RAMP superfamily)
MAACLKMYNDLSSILASEQYALTSEIVGDLNKGRIKVTFYLSSSKFEAIRKMVQSLYVRNVIRRPTIGTYTRIACLKMRDELL